MSTTVPLFGQVSGTKAAVEMKASLNAHKGDFDYLLGDWEFAGENKDGKFRGHWSAVRVLDTGQILDEFRVLGDSGETYFVSMTLRAYNAALDRWELVSVDERGTGLQNIGTARRVGQEMLVEQTFGAGTSETTFGIGTSRTWTSRIRYHDIERDRFRWTADRSTDGGTTWALNAQKIEARRVGPPRSLAPLKHP